MKAMAKYLVVLFWTANGEEPSFNSSRVKYAGDSLDEAKAALKREAEKFGNYRNFEGGEWKQGYQSDPKSHKWSESCWDDDGTAAWVTHGDSFDKVEILEWSEGFGEYRPM